VNAAGMTSLLAATVAAVTLLAGCAQRGPGPLYLWESFPRQQYETLLRNGVPPEGQIADMEAHAEKARARGAALPPGFRAHWGMLMLASGDAGRARELWQAEKAAFPESAPYIDQLIKRLEARASKDKQT
jgi:hypothetical protein